MLFRRLCTLRSSTFLCAKLCLFQARTLLLFTDAVQRYFELLQG
jgi:hypothetical protein